MEYGTPEYEAKVWAANAARNEQTRSMTVGELTTHLNNFLSYNPYAFNYAIDYIDRDGDISMVKDITISPENDTLKIAFMQIEPV